MLSINNWHHKDFLNRANLEALRKEVDDFLNYDGEREAYNLYGEISKKLEIIKGLEDGLKNNYQTLISTLRFIALPRLDDKNVVGIVKEELGVAFGFDQEDLDIQEKIRKKLASMLIENRDEYKQSLIKALSENKEVITQGDLEIDGKRSKGTVGNWMRDYRMFVAENNIDEKLTRASYLHKSKNLSVLSEEDRAKVNKLLDLYNSWQKSSWTVEGREDPMLINDNGKLYGVYNGEIFEIGGEEGAISTPQLESRIDKAIVSEQQNLRAGKSIDREVKIVERPKVSGVMREPLDTQTVLQKNWQEFLAGELQGQILEQQEKIVGELGDEMGKLRARFYHGVNEKNPVEAIGVLLVIFKNKQVGKVFGADERFQKFWGSYLEKNNMESERFKNDPANGADMANFFKYILENRLGLSEDEAVMAGMMAANLSRQVGELEYSKMVYGDLADGKFKWNI